MDTINIRIEKKTHRRLNLFKSQRGAADLSVRTPTLDEVINAGLDLLEKNTKKAPAQEDASSELAVA